MYWDIDDEISPKYMGDDMVLLLGLTDEKAKQMEEEEKEGGTTHYTFSFPRKMESEAPHQV